MATDTTEPLAGLANRIADAAKQAIGTAARNAQIDVADSADVRVVAAQVQRVARLTGDDSTEQRLSRLTDTHLLAAAAARRSPHDSARVAQLAMACQTALEAGLEPELAWVLIADGTPVDVALNIASLLDPHPPAP